MSTKADAQEELFSQIAALASSSELSRHNPAQQAEIIKDLALAYRYAAGGAQPGASVIKD